MTDYNPPLFQRPSPHSARRLLVVGDSQAVGVGTTAPEYSISGLFAAAYPDWSVETIAVTGAKLPGVTELLKKASQSHYDLILLFGGANDLLRFSPQSSIRKHLTQLIQAARPLADHVAISHGGNIGKAPVWPRFIAPYFTHRSRGARSTYMSLAPTLDFIYLDLFNSTDSYKETHAEDGLHLNDAGYAGSFHTIQKILLENGVHLEN